MKRIVPALALAAAVVGPQPALAVIVPFNEDFTSNVSGWEDNVQSPLTFEPTGGPDGGSYASTEFSYLDFVNPFGGGPVLFRANDSDNASGDAFVGNWITSTTDVALVAAWVYQETPEDLTFFIRVATSFNFPGAVFDNATVVEPFTWTELVWEIDPHSLLCSEEVVTCAEALANVGNFQIGTSAPAALVDDEQAYYLAVDEVRMIPEPGELVSLASGLLGLAALGWRRRVA